MTREKLRGTLLFNMAVERRLVDFLNHTMNSDYVTGFLDGWGKADAHPKSPWICIRDEHNVYDERLPEYGTRVLAHLNYEDKVVMGTYRFDAFPIVQFDDGDYIHMLCDVDYYMPIPKLPEEGGEE